MSALIAALYSLCILFLIGFGVFVFAKNPASRLHRYFALFSLALLGWVGSLFAFNLQTAPGELLWLGRFNFASVALAALLGYLFVREVGRRRNRPALSWLWVETGLLAAVTLLTPLVDQAEQVNAGEHVT